MREYKCYTYVYTYLQYKLYVKTSISLIIQINVFIVQKWTYLYNSVGNDETAIMNDRARVYTTIHHRQTSESPYQPSIAKLCFRSISDSLFPITGREIIFLIRSRISRGWIMLDNWVASTSRQWFLSFSPFVMPGSWPIEKTGRISNGSVSYSSLPFRYSTCQRSKISSINSGCIVRHVSSRCLFLFSLFFISLADEIAFPRRSPDTNYHCLPPTSK